MNFREIFLRLGFGKNASLLYEVLLRSKKPMLVTHLARAAGIDRPEVYRNLKLCIKRGFIYKNRVGARSYYSAKSPRILQSAFKETTTDVNDFMHAQALKIEKALPKHTEYFKGASGIRAVFDDVVDRMPKKGIFYRYTSERNLDAVNRYLSPSYRARRDKKKLERLVISNPVSGRAKKSRLERFVKFFPQESDLFDQNVIQLIYADSVAFINLTTEEAYCIRDHDLARFQAVIFSQLYKKLDR